MIAFICLFFPAVLTVWLYEHLRKTDLTVKKWLCLYAVSNMLINLACFLAKKLLLGTAAQPFYHELGDILPVTAMNYLIMAIPAAVVLGVAESFLFSRAAISLEEETDETKE